MLAHRSMSCLTRRRGGGGGTHPGEPHSGGLANRLNWLRAGVLGANDGIVSVSAIAVGVAGTLNWGPSSPRRLQVWWVARFRWLSVSTCR